MDLLAESGTQVVTNPSSNLRLRSGTLPLRKILDRGIPCALGLDGCAFDDDQDFLREMRVAGLNPAQAGIRGAVQPSEVMRMATVNGAAVAGGVLSKGRIAPGDPADFVCIDYAALEHPYACRDVDPLALLAARGTRRDVDAVYVGGKCVVREGKPQAMDMRDAGALLRSAIMEAEKRANVRAPGENLLCAVENFYGEWEKD